MKKAKQIFSITKNIFLEERNSKRVIMGYLLGLALYGYWFNHFIQYIWDTGEPVNVLEAFIVVEHHDKALLFLALGWLLIISDAPFVKGNAYLTLYRSSRKRWNMAMLQYIAVQAFLFVACILAVSIAISSLWGFWGNMWSSPVYELATDTGNRLGVEYQITFRWLNIMEKMTVPQAFMITFIFLYLYITVLGILLYVCNLLIKEVYGMLIVFGVQLSGYLLQQEGLGRFSLMTKAIPGYSIDGNGGHWKTALLFVGVILILTGISLRFIGRVDFKRASEEEA